MNCSKPVPPGFIESKKVSSTRAKNDRLRRMTGDSLARPNDLLESSAHLKADCPSSGRLMAFVYLNLISNLCNTASQRMKAKCEIHYYINRLRCQKQYATTQALRQVLSKGNVCHEAAITWTIHCQVLS